MSSFSKVLTLKGHKINIGPQRTQRIIENAFRISIVKFTMVILTVQSLRVLKSAYTVGDLEQGFRRSSFVYRLNRSLVSIRTSQGLLMRCSGGTRGGAWGPALPPLIIFLEQTEARMAEKKFFWRQSPLSQGLDEPPPPHPYMKVWICHCVVLSTLNVTCINSGICRPLLTVACRGDKKNYTLPIETFLRFPIQ